MRRSLWISFAAAVAALCATAWADDEWDQAYGSPKITRHRESSESASADKPQRNSPSREDQFVDPSSSDEAGAYFGLGDEFIYDENYNGLGRLATSRGGGKLPGNQPVHEHDWNDQPEGYSNSGHEHPWADGSDGYVGENVYGPMWGVPDDAVGLDGFSGNPYPGLMDGATDENGRPLHQHNHASKGGEQSAGDEPSSGDDVQRNHKINRGDPNEW